MRFITSVVHSVDDLKSASSFFCKYLGFQIFEESKQHIIVDNGSVNIRLIEYDNGEMIRLLHLDCKVKSLVDETKELLLFPAVNLVAESVTIGLYRIESHFNCPHGVFLVLSQEFNEDELNILPELPISLDWDEQAELYLRQLLRVVPIDFRQSARERVTEKAEMLAGGKGLITVDVDMAIQAMSEVTPLFQHDALKDELERLGVDSKTIKAMF